MRSPGDIFRMGWVLSCFPVDGLRGRHRAAAARAGAAGAVVGGAAVVPGGRGT